MRACVFGTGAVQGLAGGIVVAEALGAAPDRVAAVEMPTDGHAEAGTGPPARLLGQLEGHALEDHDIVLADGALLLLTQDRVEIDAVEGHEGAGGIGGGVRELGVVVRRDTGRGNVRVQRRSRKNQDSREGESPDRANG